MLIIWKALVTYLDNNLRQGKSVNIRNFGAFTFDIETELPKISRREINPDVDIGNQRSERKHIHHLR
jgi:nucleoid DNA-binding protein